MVHFLMSLAPLVAAFEHLGVPFEDCCPLTDEYPGRRLFTGTYADMAAALSSLSWATWRSASAATRPRSASPAWTASAPR
jgi:hypothetical protein